jgi:hypothetical protein
MLNEMLGAVSQFFQPVVGGGREFRLDAELATRLWFDDQRLTEFQAIVHVQPMPDLLCMRGRIVETGKLEVVAWIGDLGRPDGRELLRRTLDLPSNVLVNDSFTPRAELSQLRLGQSWTVPVYRPFPPNSPPQIVQAEVERHDVIFWGGDDVETFLVAYRTEAGSGLRATREPVGREWVRPDGMVLRQEISLSGMQLRFDREPGTLVEYLASDLSEKQHPERWKRRELTDQENAAAEDD